MCIDEDAMNRQWEEVGADLQNRIDRALILHNLQNARAPKRLVSPP